MVNIFCIRNEINNFNLFNNLIKVNCMTEIKLPKIPKGKELKKYIASYFQEQVLC